MEIKNIIELQRNYYQTKTTLTYSFRMEALNKLYDGILKHQKSLEEAMKLDLGKSGVESYMSEIGITLREIRFMKRHLRRYMKNINVGTSLLDFPARSFKSPHPYGVTLVMSPWNYPVLLTLCPLIGAIAAGNTCVLKPSDYSHHTSLALKNLIADLYPQEYITLVTGGREANQDLLDQKFDYIFFTGGKTVGRIVMEKAARNLTPVSLELGGKSPCIVDESANLKIAARRIAFGKFLNTGQTCVAPDYLFVHESVKSQFVQHLKTAIKDMFGETPLDNPGLGKIVNRKHYQRLTDLLANQVISIGGKTNPDTLQIEPTVLDDVKKDNIIMEDEIFGPILPILSYKNIEDVYQYINANPAPLALYLFTQNKEAEKTTLATCNFGGGCINDTVVQAASDSLPFGGVGESGMGQYHGRASFDTFTHYRSILRKANWIDIDIRYAPYTKQKERILRKLLK